MRGVFRLRTGPPLPCDPFRIRRTQSSLAVRVETGAAPAPVIRIPHKLALHWIKVHVIQLFVLLFGAPHIEVIEAALPELRILFKRGFIRDKRLARKGFVPVRPAQFYRRSSLQNLHHGRRVAHVRLADQQVEMLRHQDVPEEAEIMALADVDQDFQEEVACLRGIEEGQAMVTTACDEMELSKAVAAFKAVFRWFCLWHGFLAHSSQERQRMRHPRIVGVDPGESGCDVIRPGVIVYEGIYGVGCLS